MKQTIRILAFATALLLALPLLGCLVPKNTENQNTAAPNDDGTHAPEGLAPDGETENPGTETAAPDSGSADAAFDRDAVAIELGSVRITAGELQESFDEFVNYFAYSYGYDEEMLSKYMDMAEESTIEFYVPQWKAGELGIVLTEEQEAQCAANAHAQLDEERDDLLFYFAGDDSAKDVSDLTQEQIDAAVDTINSELFAIYGEGYDFEAYLESRYDRFLSSERVETFHELLEENIRASVVADQSAIDAQYDALLKEQQEKFDEDASLYLNSENGDGGEGTYPICLYVPKDAARLEVICVRENRTPEELIEENKAAMETLETEYGSLMLNGGDEARLREIEAEYAALKEQNATAAETLAKTAQKRIDSAYADLEGGMSFADAMDAYNEPDANDSGALTMVVFLEKDGDLAAISEAAAALEPGSYSAPFEIDGEYYIVKLIETIPAGVIDHASIEARFVDSLKYGEEGDRVWADQLETWTAEAKETAVYHYEAYDMLIDQYLEMFDY